ncbi:ATP-binding protein [Brotaphodocola sp.]|uniref:ATP-binding protein n=1 Tax=Brotaphodocola sp. TaxID=3073577 RepID=UPI003D7EA3D3
MNDNRPKRWTRTLDAVLAGVSILLLLIYLGVVYKNDRKYIADLADETITFMESVCQRYDNYELGNQAKTRQDLLEKAEVLTDFVARDQLANQDFLTEFARRGGLSGVLVLDSDQSEICGVDLDGRDAYALWKPKLEGASLKNIFEYPKKTYCGTMMSQDVTYEIACMAGGDVAVLCYIETRKIKTDVYEPSIDKILTNNTFHKNPVIIITDGMRILASNGKEIKQNIPVDKTPITNAGDLSHYEGRLIHLKRAHRSWYGKRAVYGRYYIYVFYPEKEVFTNMIALVLAGITVYAILCSFVLLLRQHSEKEYFRRERKQLNTVRAISSIYVTTAIFHLHRMEFEEILCSDRMKSFVGEKRDASEVVEILADHVIAPEFRKDYLDFMNPNTMRERLRGVKNRSAMFRDVNGTWYLCILIPQQIDENGEVRDVLVAARNVNDYKQNEERYKEELRKTARDAELANGVKSSFLRRMSHDVRTPVNGIRGMAVIAKRVASDPERVKECMDKIIFSSDYLQDLLDDILRMSKLESGEIAFEERTFNLKNILRDIKFFMEEQAEERKVHLTMNVDEITHSIVVGSPLHVRQIIQNLVSNAVKFNREDGRVNVNCREIGKVSEDGRVEYEFVIEDTGIGMTKEFQSHMFEVFTQEENTARTTYSGNGLGLLIAKELIDRMGGSVDFVSKRGFGTTFTVRLPMKVDFSQQEERREEEKKEFSIRGVRVLIAEDNELNMEIAKTLLEDEGAVITEAHDGKEAVEIFVNQEPGSFDVILMDIMMPEMDGLEASRKIRSLDRTDAQTIPIFAMTANAFIDDKKRSRLAGMNEHLSKPLDMQEVVKMIHCYCCADRS